MLSWAKAPQLGAGYAYPGIIPNPVEYLYIMYDALRTTKPNGST